MQTKTYQSLGNRIELDYYVVIGGAKRLLKFRGGSLRPRVNGKYITSDPKVIAALDKNPGNGTFYKCVLVEGEQKKESLADSKEHVADTPPPNAPEGGNQDQPDDNTPPDAGATDPVVVLEVTNLQEAKEFLVSKVDGLKLSQMPNAKSVENRAKENNFSFPNLKV